MKRRISVIVFYNIIIVLIIFLFLEICVRLLVPEIHSQGTDKALIKDNVYYSSQGLVPNTKGISNGFLLQVDKYGFVRNSIPLDTNKISILLLGDSVTMGLGIDSDSTFANMIQLHYKSVNVLNPSMFGYNIRDYGNILKYFTALKELKIKHVLLCWCLNDIYDESIRDTEVPGGGIRSVFNNFLTFLRMNSRFYLYLKSIVSDRQKSYYLFDSNLYRDSLKLNNAAASIEILNEHCINRGIKFNVLLLPYEYQVRNNETYPQNLFMSKLAESGIEVKNVFEMFKSDLSKEYYLFGDGIHFSPKGHKVIAEYITTKIVKNNLP